MGPGCLSQTQQPQLSQARRWQSVLALSMQEIRSVNGIHPAFTTRWTHPYRHSSDPVAYHSWSDERPRGARIPVDGGGGRRRLLKAASDLIGQHCVQ
eukprot:scaffold387032_cov45-Prasinocladus_malaysianus.AAC.1